MLENPYYAAQPELSAEAMLYRGEGRIEESLDGSWFTIWWESPLDEAMVVQMHYAKILGAGKQLKKTRRTLLIYLVISLIAALYGIFAPDRPGDIKQGLLFLGGTGFVMWGVTLLQVGKNYQKSMREMLIHARGTEGMIEVKTRVDAAGIYESALHTELTFGWRGVREIEVTDLNVIFYREPAAMMSVPLRVFPSAVALERFVALAQKYIKQRPG
jgi:hypothetical protein